MLTNKSFSPKQWANINTAEQIRTVTNRIVEMGIDITAGYNRWRNIAFGISLEMGEEGRSFFREVFIRRGSVGGVFGVEEPHECYMTYTTERAEKEALKLYKKELQCNHQYAIEAYCRDWELSGITKSLPFAQKVNQTGHVLNLKPKRKFDEYM